jgi:uncharacterized Fe-S cluster-containing radical SAM superfamily enzyme
MDRRPTRSLTHDLADLETDLAALTLRVAHLRTQITTEVHTKRPLIIGDRVRFRIVGQGYAEGVIIATTTHRIRIRQDTTGHIILRAPHKVSLLL